MPGSSIRSRAQGCLLGQLSGDSLGSLVEFRTAEEIAAQYPDGLRLLADGGSWSTIAGQPTDDSEMALTLARSIVAAGGYDPEATAAAYAAWFGSGPFDSGHTTRTALRAALAAVRGSRPVAEAARLAALPESQANGSLMRISPLAIAGVSSPEDVVQACARADSALTHPHPACQDACALFVTAIRFAIQTGEPAPVVYQHTLQIAANLRAEQTVMGALEAAQRVGPVEYSRQQGWVLIAFQNAFFQLLHAGGMEAGVVDTVRRGGDTDTNGAIAGALLGSVWGLESIPRQWMECVLSCRPLSGRPGVHQPRPEVYWPVDALELAGRLLETGLSATRSHAQTTPPTH